MTDTLTTLFQAEATIDVIAAHLDALEESQRLLEVREFPGSLQSKLYDLAAGSPPIRVEAFVPEVDVEVMYSGKNSAPAFKYFSKAFWRKPGASEAIGYNVQFWRWASGPGYFTAVDDPESGELLFDYTKVPDWKPEAWPALEPNSGIIAGPVYKGMMDYNRWVSKTTAIGRAFKGGSFKEGKNIAHYLVTRVTKPPPAAEASTEEAATEAPAKD